MTKNHKRGQLAETSIPEMGDFYKIFKCDRGDLIRLISWFLLVAIFGCNPVAAYWGGTIPFQEPNFLDNCSLLSLERSRQIVD